MKLIDVHTHLNMLEIPTDEALQAAKQAGVERCINIGTCPTDWEQVSTTAQKYFPQVAAFVGLHPHDAKLWDAAVEKQLRSYLQNPWILGIGEIGLDYYYNNSDREQQISAFRRQMEIAAEMQIPVEIHTRDADDDTLVILDEFHNRVTGLLHCFTGTQRLAEGAWKRGFHFSISGVVTFKKADDLRQVVEQIPLEHLHLETDAPFLSPVPLRGKKNQPAHMIHTAQQLAQLKKVALPDLSAALEKNARRLFHRWNL